MLHITAELAYECCFEIELLGPFKGHLECDSITENWWQHGKLVWCAVLGGGLEEETATKQLGSVV